MHFNLASRPLLLLSASLLMSCGGGSSDSAPSPVAPAITAQPVDVSITSDQSATFTCTVSGTEPTYKWLAQASGSSTWVDISSLFSNFNRQWEYNGSGVSGSGKATLVLNTPAVGVYKIQCTFTNAAGSVTTTSATLTVRAASGSGGNP